MQCACTLTGPSPKPGDGTCRLFSFITTLSPILPTRGTTWRASTYYRGVHRKDGKRAPAEYVGTGRIGDIWLDPELRKDGRKAWYCGIDDYRRFAVSVPAKVGDVTLEQIPANLWRDGVRLIDPDIFNRILNLAAEHRPEGGGVSANAANIETADNLIVPQR